MRIVFQALIFSLVLLNSFKVFAAGDGIPAGTVLSQLANLSILIGVLFFSLRKSISAAFAAKRETFLANVNSASKSKKEAETKLAEVAKRVRDLQQTFDKQIEEAKLNAEESYRSQLASAKNEALRLQALSNNSLEFEIQKQIENLRIETFQKSAQIAEQKLVSNLTPDQAKTWNSNFVKNAQGAH